MIFFHEDMMIKELKIGRKVKEYGCDRESGGEGCLREVRAMSEIGKEKKKKKKKKRK